MMENACLMHHNETAARLRHRVFSRLSPLMGALLMAVTVLSGCSDTWNDPHAPEPEDKVTYYASYSNQPRHLDPVRAYSAEEGLFLEQIYEPPLQYHFLKRPYELITATASEMPTVTYLDENRQPLGSNAESPAYSVFTVKIQSGIRYQPHPALAKAGGHALYFFEHANESAEYGSLNDFAETGSRELLADDYIYAIKRIGDPANKSPLIGFMADYIVGLKDFTKTIAEERKAENIPLWLDLRQHDMSGLKKIDDHTFAITINGKYPQFRYWLATRFFSPLPWEADRFYHNPGFKERNLTLDWHPIGTGPFMMAENDPNRKIVLVRNPNFREELYPDEGAPGDEQKGLLADAGQALPMIDQAIFVNEKASIPQWKKFLQGYYDRSGDESSNINSATFDQAFNTGPDGMSLSEELLSHGVRVDEEIRPSLYYTGFNMLDPVVGGYSEKQRKLRRAISIAWDDQEFIDIFYNGLGQQAQSPIPPGLFGAKEGREGINPLIFDWDEQRNRPVRKSIEYAKKLLAEAGYPGGRDAVTGKPLVLYLDTAGSDSGPGADWMRKQLDKLGIQLEFRPTDYTRFKEKMRQGNTQIFRWGWLADYPDPENFLFMLDSHQGAQKCKCDGVNTANYDNPEYDRLFDQMKTMDNGPERAGIIDKMVDIVRRDNPWIMGFHVKDYYLSNAWVHNTKRHGISLGTLKYVRVEPALREEKQLGWNRPILIPLLITLGIVIALVIPAVRAYRRRQHSTVVGGRPE
ncbi:ABC transporter substrate-binding protein [Kistimonas scapharcae]|uniref:ABC transporter substrate-binding protein n=1 Tax=Kistimonas scapharcae TaxID=1036133 RepID=A0ABP8V344_9GAMM